MSKCRIHILNIFFHLTQSCAHPPASCCFLALATIPPKVTPQADMGSVLVSNIVWFDMENQEIFLGYNLLEAVSHFFLQLSFQKADYKIQICELDECATKMCNVQCTMSNQQPVQTGFPASGWIASWFLVHRGCGHCPLDKPQRRWTNQISNMILHLVSVVLLLCVTPLLCVLNKCTKDQTCVEINKCREWCARIENAGSVSELSENEKVGFRKSFCGFRKNDLMVCCEAQSESPVCGLTKSNPKNTLSHSCGKIKVNGFN